MEKVTSQNIQLGNRISNWLGYLGLLPFYTFSLFLWLPIYEEFFVKALAIYAAVILTFIGATHWGIAMTTNPGNQNNFQYVFSIIPSLVAWLILLLDNNFTLLALAICFVSFWLSEYYFYSNSLPSWYLKLRTKLSLSVAGFLVFAWLGIL